MILYYLVMAHHRPRRFGDLLDAVTSDAARVIMHVDRKSDAGPSLLAAAPYEGVRIINDDRRTDVRWGGWSQVEATLQLMQAAVDRGGLEPDDYLILLSGDSYLLQPPEVIESVLASRRYQFIDSLLMTAVGSKPLLRVTTMYWEAARGRHSLAAVTRAANRLAIRRPYRRALGGRTLRTGSQWWALMGDAVQWILAEMRRDRRFTRFCRHSRVPDEFFQTLLANTRFASDVRQSLLLSIWSEDSEQSSELVRKRRVKEIASNVLLMNQRDYDVAPVLFVRKLAGPRSAVRIRHTVWPLRPALVVSGIPRSVAASSYATSGAS